MFSNRDEVFAYSFETAINSTELFLAQIYALYEIANWKRAQIAELTGYAPSTISSKRSKMRDYSSLAELVFILEQVEQIAEIEAQANEANAHETIYRRFKDGRNPIAITFASECGDNVSGQQAVYFFKFYSTSDVVLFDKIGTSAKNVIGRLRDEIGEYVKKFDIEHVEVCRIVPLGEYPAEGAESALRADFIHKYPQAFRKNDRFFNVDIDPKFFDKVMNEYFNN